MIVELRSNIETGQLNSAWMTEWEVPFWEVLLLLGASTWLHP